MGALQSMTGYGAAASRHGDCSFEVTLRSVNHRHLDVVYRVPPSARALTARMTEQLELRFRRGRIEVAVDQVAGSERLGQLDLEAARWLGGMAEELRREGLGEGVLSVADVLAHPASLRPAGVVPIDAAGATGRCLFDALEQAADRLLESRLEEGAALGRRLVEQVEGLAGVVDGMRERIEPATAEAMTRYRDRIRQLVETVAPTTEVAVDEDRLVQEAAILAERGDVAEELDRLEIHLDAVRDALEGPDATGRRLDFLAQEILRELNTVGSKSRDGQLSSLVVEGKVFCERLREQAQNVE